MRLRTSAVLAALLAIGVMAAMASTASAKVRYCHGVRATIVRGSGNNHIRGTRHRDVIFAGRGRDIVLGRGGNDLICAGRGNDVVDGGKGLISRRALFEHL